MVTVRRKGKRYRIYQDGRMIDWGLSRKTALTRQTELREREAYWAKEQWLRDIYAGRD